MKNTLAFTAALLVTGSASAASFNVGDVQIVGFQADTPDGFDFVTWVDLTAGTQLYFTDSGVFASGEIRGTEGDLVWTAPAGGVAAGTVINWGFNTGADLGSMASSGGTFSLSSSGDQIFIGDADFPNTNPGTYVGNFIYGVDWESLSWNSGSTGSTNSLLPASLNTTDGNNNFGESDNGVYIGPRAGLTIAQFKAEIANQSNWVTTNSTTGFSLDSTDFSIVPEPTSLALLGLGGLIIARRRRG